MIVTELVLARHGEAVCNADGVVGGPTTCTGLTERGRGQTERLAHRLGIEHGEQPFTAFYTTVRPRVAQSAAAVAKVIGMAPVPIDTLIGLNPGTADGQPWPEVKNAFGGPPHHDPDRPFADGAETWSSYLDRAGKTLIDIINRDGGGRILIVAHGETIEAAMTLLLRLPPGTSTHAGFVTDHTSITRWKHQRNRFGQDTWLLCGHNDTSHLDTA